MFKSGSQPSRSKLRRGHDGLMSVVRNAWDLDPFSGHLFVFLGRRQDRCKILFWDRGGFVVYYKRLEKPIPHPEEGRRIGVGDDRRDRARHAARRNRRHARAEAAALGAEEGHAER